MRALLEELGNPHLGRVTVHVAGSKGKGSVAAMVASMLQAAGLRTGLYTSPHLCRFPERIQVDGRPVDPADFAAGLDEVRAAVERVSQRLPERPIVTFDALTALGFLLTVVTIQGVPVVAAAYGWPVAVALLSVGPLLGAIAMVRLSPLLPRS